MKNGKVVTAYLDECAAIEALKHDQEAWLQRMTEGVSNQLWRACLDDGWTVAELDAAFTRRFGRVVDRGEGLNQ